MQKIAPFLWFDGKAEEALSFYTSIFKNSRVTSVMRYGEAGPGPKGSVMGASFELEGQEFMAINGGPMFSFTPAISFFVKCETQQEIDDYVARLSEGGEVQPCGWLKDRYGLSWQIVPKGLTEVLSDPDPARAERAMKAMLGMRKLDIQALRDA